MSERGSRLGSEDVRAGRLSALLDELARAPDRAPGDWETHFHPGMIVGRFRLLREIGRGAFGVVFEALDTELGRLVAFKALRPSRTTRTPDHQALLLREAEAAARLNHPAICTLHDVGHCEGGPYLVLERLEGETLEDRLRRGPLPPAGALSVALGVAGALAHAHLAGVVHRDLKPANVFLSERGDVKVLDFGLSRFLGESGAGRGGSPAYMSPEQWRGEPVDAATDVFAMGVMLFEMLAGQRPFSVEGDRSTALDAGPVPALPAGAAPTALAAVVARLLARAPGDRPRNGQVALEELLAAHRVLEAGRPSRWGLAAARGPAARFVEELYRRRVPGATIAYLAASFVLLLAGEVAAWALDLPRWTLHALAILVLVGLPVNTILAWYFDVVPAGRRPGGAGEPPGPRVALRKPGPATVGALALAAFVGAAWRWWPRPEPPLGRPLPVAVADLASSSGDPDLEGLSPMLGTALEQSQRIVVLPRSRMVEALGTGGSGNQGPIDEARGLAAARAAGAEFLVVASVRRFDDVIAVDARVLDVASGETVFSLQDRGRGKSSVPDLIDRVASRIRSGLRGRGRLVLAAERHP